MKYVKAELVHDDEEVFGFEKCGYCHKTLLSLKVTDEHGNEYIGQITSLLPLEKD